jgi:hypothetical protein
MRRGELKVDPEKVRAWVARSREKAAVAARGRPRKGLTSKRRSRPAEGPLTPKEWWTLVYRQARGRCAVTRAQASSVYDRRFERHHIIPQQVLKRHRLHMKLWDTRNGMLVHRNVHANHTAAVERIPRSALPSSVYAFAAECGPWAEAYLDRNYA